MPKHRMPIGQNDYIDSEVDEQERITLTFGYTDSEGKEHTTFRKRLDDAGLNAIQDALDETQQMLMVIREIKRKPVPIEGIPQTIMNIPVPSSGKPPRLDELIIQVGSIDRDTYSAPDNPPTDEVLDGN